MSRYAILPRKLGIIGYSGAGKTTLITRLVPRLRARGLRVGVLKHDAHRLEFDKPGKDSFRIRESGADVVAVASRDMVFLSAPPPESASPDALIRTLFAGMELDLVLIEGFTGHLHPKVEVVHPEKGPRGEPGADRVVTWLTRSEVRAPAGMPVFAADDVDRVIDHLMREGWVPRVGVVRERDTRRAGS